MFYSNIQSCGIPVSVVCSHYWLGLNLFWQAAFDPKRLSFSFERTIGMYDLCYASPLHLETKACLESANPLGICSTDNTISKVTRSRQP